MDFFRFFKENMLLRMLVSLNVLTNILIFIVLGFHFSHPKMKMDSTFGHLVEIVHGGAKIKILI